MYGIVPEEVYTGMMPGQKFHDDVTMHKEMKAYLENIKSTHAWSEEEAIKVIKSILNHYMGELQLNTERIIHSQRIFNNHRINLMIMLIYFPT
jgi:bleomycin hydrolase